MLMWAMSDRAIPRSYRTMQGFGVHTYRLVNAAGESHVRQVPLDARSRHALAGLGRGGQDLRRRLRLPSPRSVGGDRGRRLSRMGAGPADLHRGAGRGLHLRRPRRDQDRARRAGADRPGRPDGAEPQSRQLLRRDRAGGVLRRARRARASTSPTIRCSRAASTPTSTRRSRGSAGRTSTRSRSTRRSRRSTTTSATACIARRSIAAACRYEPNSLGGGCPFQAGAAGFVSFPEPRDEPTTTRCAARPSGSPITTRRRRCSGTARRDVEKHAHHQRLPLRAVARADAGGPRADGVGPDERRAELAEAVADGPRHARAAGADAEGADARRHAGGHDVAGAVAVRAARRRQHPDAAGRDPRRRRLRRRRRSRRSPSG